MKVRTIQDARITNTSVIVTVFVMGFLLVGCGGGSDSDNNTSTSQQVETGVFLDSAVSGLHYETDTLSGETNADGEFHYREGEMVTFSIGNIMFGEAMGQATMTPLNLVPDA